MQMEIFWLGPNKIFKTINWKDYFSEQKVYLFVWIDYFWYTAKKKNFN